MKEKYEVLLKHSRDMESVIESLHLQNLILKTESDSSYEGRLCSMEEEMANVDIIR